MRGGGSVLKARQRRRGGTPPLALSDVPSYEAVEEF